MGEKMFINFRNVQTQRILFSKECEFLPPLPANGQAFRLDDGRCARVIDIEFFVSKRSEFNYEKIEVFLEVFEKEQVSENPKPSAT
jgi:hypothetical protein